MSSEPDVPVPIADLLANRAWVRALARSLSASVADADDLEQDALAATLLHPPEEGRPLRPWLAQVIANLARKRLRGDARRTAREQDARGATPLPTPGELVERVATQRDVVEAVMALREPYRSTLLLRYYEDLPAVEIARRQGIPAATARQRIKRGLARLRERLGSRYGGDDALLAHLLLLGRPDATPPKIVAFLAMKKAVAGLVVVLALAGVWLLRPQVQPRMESTPAQTAKEEVVVGASSASTAPVAASTLRKPVAESPSDEPSPTGTLLVRVLRLDDGSPFEGEVVTVRHRAGALEEDFALRTDENGEASLSGLEPGDLRIGSVRSGDESTWLRVEPGTRVEATLRIAPGVRIDGRVVDGSGLGIPGAEIWMTLPWNRLRGHVITTADARGAFVLDDVQPYGHNWIGARAPGRARSRWHYFEGEPGEQLELRIVLDRPGFRVRGSVVDARGAPIASARVLVGIESADWAASPTGAMPERTVTSTDGRFEVDGVASGTWPLLARAPGFGVYESVLEVADASRDDVWIVLVPEARVNGLVVDGARRPVEGARERTSAHGTLAASATTTGEDGRFTLTGLPSSEVRVEASKDWIGGAETTLVLRPGDETAWNPVLVPVPCICGTVLDADGRPVRGVEISTWVPVDGEPEQHFTTTDEAGRFLFAGLPSKRHVVEASVDTSEYVPLVQRGVRPSLEPMELRLERHADVSGTLVGRVLGPDGRPVPSARLYAEHVTRESLRQDVGTDDATGAFELRLHAGRVRLSVESDEYPPLDVGERDLAVGQRLDLGVLTFDEPAFVEGAITGIADEHLESLDLTWFDAAGEELGSGSRTDRRYVSPPLPAGPIELVARGEYVEPLELSFVVERGQHVERALELRPAGLVTVVLDLPPGAERPDHVWGELRDGEERRLWATDEPVAPIGEMELRVFAAEGTWTFRAGTSTGLRAEGAVAVPPYGGHRPPVHVELLPE